MRTAFSFGSLRPASDSRARRSGSSTSSPGRRGEAPRYPLSLVAIETTVIPSFRANRPVSVDVDSVEVAEGSGAFTPIAPPASPWQVNASQVEGAEQPPRVVRVSSDGFFSLDVFTGSVTTFPNRGSVTFTRSEKH